MRIRPVHEGDRAYDPSNPTKALADEDQQVAVVEDTPGGEKVIGYAKDVEGSTAFFMMHSDPRFHVNYFQGRQRVGQDLAQDDGSRHSEMLDFAARQGATKSQLDDLARLEGKGVDAELAMRRLGEEVAEEDETTVRQNMRRTEALAALFDSILAKRAAPGAIPHGLHVTWEEYARMHQEYQHAQREGRHRAFEFQPLSAYSGKLLGIKADGSKGRKIRDIFQNEVGIWTDRNGVGRIILLQDRGPGDHGEKYHRVGVDLEREPDAPLPLSDMPTKKNPKQ